MKSILVPTDFSTGAENAVNYAVELSKNLKAKLILHHAYHVPIPATDIPMDEDLREQMMEENNEKLQNIKLKLLRENKDLNVDCSLDFDLAVDSIVEGAREKQADLIVMGTKGASGAKEFFFGSNAASVIEKASCPVLVVPGGAQFRDIKKIAYATDFRHSDFQSIRFLSEIASLFNSEILIVHISEVAPSEGYESELLEWFKKELRQKANVTYNNISFHVSIGGNVDYELEDFIEENNIDLLALSMRKRNIFSRLFERSLTKKIAYHTHIPLLSFHSR